MVVRGRPRKDKTVNHMIGTRLTDEQWQYVKKLALHEHLSVGAALRRIVEEWRQTHKA